MIPTIAIANFFISKSLATGRDLTPMKLIKMVYIAHGWYLAYTDEPLIGDGVQAWKYGPVIPSLYDHFKRYRDNQITSVEQAYVPEMRGFAIPAVRDDDVKVKQFLDNVWDAYSGYSAIQLSTMTHQPGTPWYETWVLHRGSETMGSVIPNDSIKLHYKKLLAERVPNANAPAREAEPA